MPFDLGGFHWGDDIVFDQGTGELDLDTGFEKATDIILEKLIRKSLVEKCGYRLREIMLFGFGQGGMAALNVAARMASEEKEELGGVVSIGAPLPTSAKITDVKKPQTPILVCKAKSRSAVKDSDIARLKETFEYVQVVEWKKTGDGMPSNREEMLPIMQFFARRLRSTRGVLEGSIEIT
jgi:predicted esterase